MPLTRVALLAGGTGFLIVTGFLIAVGLAIVTALTFMGVANLGANLALEGLAAAGFDLLMALTAVFFVALLACFTALADFAEAFFGAGCFFATGFLITAVFLLDFFFAWGICYSRLYRIKEVCFYIRFL